MPEIVQELRADRQPNIITAVVNDKGHEVFYIHARQRRKGISSTWKKEAGSGRADSGGAAVSITPFNSFVALATTCDWIYLLVNVFVT